MATITEQKLIELGELVEELQAEMETFEVARRSPLQINLISQLTGAVIEQAQLLRQSVLQIALGDESQDMQAQGGIAWKQRSF